MLRVQRKTGHRASDPDRGREDAKINLWDESGAVDTFCFGGSVTIRRVMFTSVMRRAKSSVVWMWTRLKAWKTGRRRKI